MAALLLAACSPTLDWREFSPQGSGIVVTFPCRSDRHSRPVELAGTTVTMTLLSCETGGAHYSIGFLDVADPAGVTRMLAEWRRSASANMQARTLASLVFRVKGMTANDEAVRVHLSGRLPNGLPVTEHAAYFVRGLRLYQAAVTGAEPSAADVDAFFAGLRFAPVPS